jgi:hypothetical protein
MPNPWTGKGNPYTRNEVVERLRATLKRGDAIIAAGAGTGISAKFIEKGRADLIIIYNSGRFRMMGHGSTCGLMAYGDANAIAMEIGEYEVLPVVEECPVICGVHATDPRRRMWHWLLQVKDMGFSGVNNFPTHTIVDGHFRGVLEETGMHVLHCPCCNLKLGSGIAQVPEMLARGINVALGSDGTPSNNNFDMFIEMRVSSLIHKYRLGAEAMPAASVLRMATRNGAKALDLGGSSFGSLEPGKKADLIILDNGGLHAAPLPKYDRDDPVRRIVSAYQSSSVRTSIIDGNLVMQDGKLLTMDEDEVMSEASTAWNTIAARINQG